MLWSYPFTKTFMFFFTNVFYCWKIKKPFEIFCIVKNGTPFDTYVGALWAPLVINDDISSTLPSSNFAVSQTGFRLWCSDFLCLSSHNVNYEKFRKYEIISKNLVEIQMNVVYWYRLHLYPTSAILAFISIGWNSLAPYWTGH